MDYLFFVELNHYIIVGKQVFINPIIPWWHLHMSGWIFLLVLAHPI